MKTFTLNGKELPIKDITFNTVVEWEDEGISLDSFAQKPLTMVRAYVSYAAGISLDEAGEEMNQHIINGGNLNDVMSAINEAFTNSGFFRALNQGTQKKNRKSAE